MKAPTRCSAGPARFAGTVALGLSVIAAGCGERRQGAGGVPVRFSYQDRVADAVSIVASRQGFFAAEGLSVRPSCFSSGPACSETLYTGAADVATMGDATAIIAVARKAPVRIVASHGGGEHRHRIVAAAAAGVTSVQDLAGKRIGVKKGTSTYGGLLAFLDKRGIPRSAVELVDMRPADMPEALASGAVAAVAASEPTPTLAEARGCRAVATLGGLDNSYPIMLVMREEFVRRRPGDAARFLRGLKRGAEFIRSRPEEAAAVLAAATGLPLEVARQAMARHTYDLSLDASVLGSLAKTAAFLKAQGVVEEAPDLDAAMDRAHLARAQR